jgi:hypothetical protein
MVAIANHHCITFGRCADYFGQQFSNCPLCLYLILNRMKNHNPKDAIIAITGCLILFYLIYKLSILLIIAMCFILIGLISSNLSSKISWLWMGIAKVLGYVNSRLLLGAIFFMILTPLAVIRRKLISKVKYEENSSTFFERDYEFVPDDFEKPF